MSSYTINHKHGRDYASARTAGAQILPLGVLNKKRIISLALVGFEIVIAKSYSARSYGIRVKYPRQIDTVSIFIHIDLCGVLFCDCFVYSC